MNEAVDILYIEDDDIDIKAMEREFAKTKKPVQIVIAKDGEEALDKLYGRNKHQKIRPSIILLDLNIPKISGIDFLRELRKDPGFVDIKVFVLTGAYSSEEKLAANELNVSGCIIKPLQYADALNILWCMYADEELSKLFFMQ